MIIGLHGGSGTGKHELASVLSTDFGYEVVSFTEVAQHLLYGLNPIVHATLAVEGGVGVMRLRSLVDQSGWAQVLSEYDEVRSLVSRMSHQSREVIHEDVLVTTALKNYTPTGKYVVVDVQSPNEARAIAQRKGVLVNVVRSGHEESSLPEELFDLTMNNDRTLEGWHDQAVALVKDALDTVARRSLDTTTPAYSSHYGMR